VASGAACPGAPLSSTGDTRMDNVLVTGAASGIGAGLAAELARAGKHVIVSDLRLDDAKAVASSIRATGGSAEAHAMDVGSDGSVAAAMRAGVSLQPVMTSSGGKRSAIRFPAASNWTMRGVNSRHAFDDGS